MMERRPRGLSTGRLFLAVLLSAAPSAAQVRPDAEANFNAGLAHLRDGRPALALEEFKKAIRQDPKNPYFQKGLGLAYARQNKFPEAIAAFHKALRLNPYYADVRNDLGTVLILSGKRAEGKAEFLAAFNDAMNPTPEISSRNLGQAYLDEKNYSEAINWFRTSLGRNKSYGDAYLGLSEALLALGRGEEVISLLETAVKEVPENPELLLGLGQAYQQAGRFAQARARLEEAVRKDPLGGAGRRAAELLKGLPR